MTTLFSTENTNWLYLTAESDSEGKIAGDHSQKLRDIWKLIILASF